MLAVFFLAFCFIFAFFVTGPAGAFTILFFQLIALFFNSRGSRAEKKAAKAYAATARKHKEIQDKRTLELLTRRRLLRRKALTAAILYILGTILIVVCTIIEKKMTNVTEGQDLLIDFIRVVGGVLCIVAVFVFAKDIHDPLTPDEATELQEKDEEEKGE